MCAVDDAEPFKFTAGRVERRARKEHFCDECQRKIARGESYAYIAGVVDSGWAEFHTCRHCEAAGSWLVVMCGGYPLTMLRDELADHRTEYPASGVLETLQDAVEARWHDGADVVPDVDSIRADARRCMEALAA